VTTILTAQQKTLVSNDTLQDVISPAPIIRRFSTDAGISFTQTVTASAINTNDGPGGTNSVVEGTTADPEATYVRTGVVNFAMNLPRQPVYPPNFNDAREAPPILGPDNQGEFPKGHIPIPTIP
jgi:hypothetical protein